MWGTRTPQSDRCHGSRFIPACVGNSLILPMLLPPRTVHPRVCGELALVPLTCSVDTGSSPRVWGTPPVVSPCLLVHRFIPACVGNSRASGVLRGLPPVHPRVCGELDLIARKGKLWFGSSPRVWGTRFEPRYRKPDRRFIPACVGNSISIRSRSPESPVHPRVCGELSATTGTIQGKFGSSPRVWGTRSFCYLRLCPERFIPACVGELPSRARELIAGGGSSPRVWGTLCSTATVCR